MEQYLRDAESAWKSVFRVLGLVYGLFLLGVIAILLTG